MFGVCGVGGDLNAEFPIKEWPAGNTLGSGFEGDAGRKQARSSDTYSLTGEVGEGERVSVRESKEGKGSFTSVAAWQVWLLGCSQGPGLDCGLSPRVSIANRQLRSGREHSAVKRPLCTLIQVFWRAVC